MKIIINPDTTLVQSVREGLKENDGYCPCVINSKGQKKYKCPCENFRLKTPIGEACHCGLYIKGEV